MIDADPAGEGSKLAEFLSTVPLSRGCSVRLVQYLGATVKLYSDHASVQDARREAGSDTLRGTGQRILAVAILEAT